MNKEQIVAIIQRGYFTDGDLADALLTELAKVSEPVHWRAILQNHQGEITATPKIAGFQDLKDAEQFCAEKKDFQGWSYAIEPLYLHAAQPDLVDENECKEWALLMKADIEQLREQLATAQHERNICQAECIRLTNDYNAKLSAAQASEYELLKAANQCRLDLVHQIHELADHIERSAYCVTDPDMLKQLNGQREHAIGVARKWKQNGNPFEAIAAHKVRKDKA